MLIVRPVEIADHKEILALAREAGIGMTSLPPDAGVLERKIKDSVASFAGKPHYERGEKFLFALEDTSKRKLVGTTGVVAHVGTRSPFYSYKLSTIVQASAGLDIYSYQRVLHMVNDYTGTSEIGSLFVLPEYRRDGIGKFLSRCRYLMLAEFPKLFDDTVVSEIRGVQDANGDSPFYNNLARIFFQMEFKRADFIHATQGGQFISDLMPKYPIYVNLLPTDAQAVIGVPLEASKPAKHMLEQEGFRWQGYVDVFDAGPTMQAECSQIRTVRESKKAPVGELKPKLEGDTYMVANTALKDFRLALMPLLEHPDGSVTLSEEAVGLLGVKKGEEVRYAKA